MSQDKATTYHAPVLLEEVLQWMQPRSGGRYVDGTAGGGGHTAALLEASAPEGQVLAIDRDPEAIEEVEDRLGDARDRLKLVHGNYSDAPRIIAQEGWETVDGWLVDAGVSSHQFDTGRRGFSIRHDGPLDMRMGPEATAVGPWLDGQEVDEIARVLKEYGEVSRAWRMAKAIAEARADGELERTGQLAQLVVDVLGWPPKQSTHPAATVFQALRIAVNEELDHLRRAVEAVPQVVGPGGRAVFISFHSLEDRIVKHGFRQLEDPCTCPPDFPICGCGKVSKGEVLTSRPVEAGEEERATNPRAHSAKLRVFEVQD